jgi:alginate O-acetyltransferase complex protein AlgI
MTFTSLAFSIFTLAVLIVSAACGRQRRWLVLLLASYAFYVSWSPFALPAVLAAVTLVTYFCANGIERHATSPHRDRFFWLGVASTLFVLLTLKYAAFLVENVNGVAALLGRPAPLRPVGVLLSVGVSYYVLQAISYLIDVRDGVVPAERHLGRHALALAFFPKLVQGPIERADGLLPQLRDPRPLRIRDVSAGAQLFVWGLFQKVVVADRLAPFADSVFSDVRHHAGLPLLIGTYFYAAQIYFDFAGYTDMALGVGRALGVRLTPNFASPYLARSIGEFWRRWHISLSSWLLDYVFRPLQLELRDWRTWGTPVALMVTFLVSGLWHGASWTFVAWGLLHGIFLAASVLYRPWQRKLHRALGLTGSPVLAVAQVAVTFHLVCFAWIFFRAGSLEDALDAVRLLSSGLPATLVRAAGGHDLDALLYLGQGRGAFLTAFGSVVMGGALRSLLKRPGFPIGRPEEDVAPLGLWPAYARTAVYALLLYGILVLGTVAQSFLYTQF